MRTNTGAFESRIASVSRVTFFTWYPVLPLWFHSTQGSDCACPISMGWQMSAGPACAKVVNPSRTATMLIARFENACEFMFQIPPAAALTHVPRDACKEGSVNKRVGDMREKLEVLTTRSDASGHFSRTGVAVPVQERSQWRQTEMSSKPSSFHQRSSIG